ncbi:citrate/2-methylcitrate synthase [Kribbella sp. NPDC004875]|uniref:citrate/2-methylcitrate synthase n=1 Tax=Kribbella sp. NPDC004875 TaxID=3364107 RepID=UPI00368FBBF8
MTAEGDENYLTTAEVARRLQVKPETVYAYVSRGMLTSVRARGRRGSLFAAGEVERLASRSVEHSGVVERIESQLTLLQDDELYYRGHPARSLATTATVEQVAHFLWTGQPIPSGQPGQPEAVDGFVVGREGVLLARRAMEVVPDGARLTDRLRVAVAVLGAADPLRFDLSTPAVTAAAGTLIETLVAALPGPTAARTTLGGRLWPKLSDHEPRPELLDATLILLADHGLAVSTVAARVAASARANLYAVISAGLGALDGQYHGAAPTLAYEFLARAMDDPLTALSDQLRSGEPVPGFGHKIYQQHDPRADVLLELLGDHPVVDTIAALAERTPKLPNSDLAIAAIMHAYDFRPDAGDALFALARMIGWTAHALEEYAAPALRFRTLGIYTGRTT